MNNLNLAIDKRPLKVSVTRINNFFEQTNPYMPSNTRVIKDYVYYPEKRVIA